ncbi:MAG: hypothetical protein FJ271_12805 [Planctomycetes bacterium]|nr:hypothetical protein [Planctomycetota bacterium]
MFSKRIASQLELTDATMNSESISILVRDTLAGYHYAHPPQGTTIGVPWSREKVDSYVERLKRSLVEPYIQRFELRETYEQVRQVDPSFAELWVVADAGNGYLEWYDPASGEFGLGIQAQGSERPIAIGVRGDLVGVFCAI